MLRTLFVTLTLIVVSACGGGTTILEPEPAALVLDQAERKVGTALTCDGDAPDKCAIGSRLQDLADAAFAGPESPHHLHILNIGDDALLARIHLVRAARESIDIQTYIWANDDVGRLLFGELLAAARRGVEVRILADQLYTAGDPKILAAAATSHANLKLKFFNPIKEGDDTSSLKLIASAACCFDVLNRRMHNKVFLVDGRIAIIGGRNVQNNYYDRDPVYTFKDREVLVMGPVSQDIGASFEEFWAHDRSVDFIRLGDISEAIKSDESLATTVPPTADIFAEVDILADAYDPLAARPAGVLFSPKDVSFLADDPNKVNGDGEDRFGAIREDLKKATRSLTMQTPYFVFPADTMQLLGDIRERSPGMRFTMSTNSLAAADHVAVYAISQKQKRQVIETLGFEVFELQPAPADFAEFVPRYDALAAHYAAARPGEDLGDLAPTLEGAPRLGIHAKTTVIDRQFAVVGSHNFDPRRQDLNTESIIIINDAAVAGAIEDDIMRDTEPANSWVVGPRISSPVVGFLAFLPDRVLSTLPLFDVWPLRETTSFALNEGKEPVPISDARFHSHYADVGQFPEVNLSARGFKARLIRGFGGLAKPLL